MTDKNLTEVVAIIDRSGSMQNLVSDTIGGFNSFLEKQKGGEGKILITLAQFDDVYQIDYEGVDANEVQPLTTETYCPRGATALLDAVGKTVNAVGQRLSNTPEEQRPGQVIFLIITDGQENSSKEFQASIVKDMVKHQVEKYSWSFVYLGGGDIETQREQGTSLGIHTNNVLNYTASSAGTRAVYDGLSSGLSRRRAAADSDVLLDASHAFLNEEETLSLIVDDTVAPQAPSIPAADLGAKPKVKGKAIRARKQ